MIQIWQGDNSPNNSPNTLYKAVNDTLQVLNELEDTQIVEFFLNHESCRGKLNVEGEGEEERIVFCRTYGNGWHKHARAICRGLLSHLRISTMEENDPLYQYEENTWDTRKLYILYNCLDGVVW